MNDIVLIVDDSLTVRMDLAEAFDAAGFTTVLCATATDAREALARVTPSTVILDVLLPDGDGIDLLRELRAAPATAATVVLVLSSEAEVKDRVRGLQTGADEYVGKPYDASYVVAKSKELLRDRRAASSPAASTILVIDDSITFREALREALEAEGRVVRCAGSGEEGLRMAADETPTAIIVDGVLPGIDGATVVRRLRLDAALRGVPCVLLTGSEDRDAELRALDAGADAFVRKEDDVHVVLARLAAVLRRAPMAAPNQAPSSLGPKRVLAVDDSPTYLYELANTLRGEGYDVVLARLGEEALELLSIQTVDCILLDLLMPGIGGQEACRRIKAAPTVREIPLIMLTALDDRRAMLEGLSAGADDYISKSSEFEVLKARVRAQIRRKQFEDEHRRIREELLKKEIEATEARAAKELAETRAQLVEELERKNRELEAFSYSVSHDLRTPLRGIDGFSQALLEDYSHNIDAKGQDYLRRVRAGAQRMGELIDDLLELSKVARADLVRTHVDLSNLARIVIADLERQSPHRRVEVTIEDDLTLEADNRMMKIVLENLLGNAWKFTEKNANAKIELFGANRAEGRVFSIRDNGAGFNMSYAEKLFRPFQRLHNDDDFPGTGIGLATVQRIADRHGGKVWAEGVVGAGATFSWTMTKKTGTRS